MSCNHWLCLRPAHHIGYCWHAVECWPLAQLQERMPAGHVQIKLCLGDCGSLPARLLLECLGTQETKDREQLHKKCGQSTYLLRYQNGDPWASMSFSILQELNRLCQWHVHSTQPPSHEFKMSKSKLADLHWYSHYFSCDASSLLRLPKSNIEVRQDAPKFLNAKIWLTHIIAEDIES